MPTLIEIGRPRPPIRLEPAYPDPAAVTALIGRHAPYWPIQRYFGGGAEQRAAGSGAADNEFIVPWFRGDWVLDGDVQAAGAELVMHNPVFLDAAARQFDAEVVRPTNVYINLNPPVPFGGPPHIDVPAFRGITRNDYPIWLLHRMGASGLFEAERIEIATCVSWFYAGPGGEFEYWPTATDEPSATETSPYDNVAVMGDNDRMFHRVGAVGHKDDFQGSVTLDSELRWDGEASTWTVVDGDDVLHTYPAEQVRVSISWKADVFADAAAAQVVDEHADDLALETVVDRLLADLRARGVEVADPSDPLTDEAFIDACTDAYPWPL
ncbi:MAG: hypothetical protein ACR2QE_09575 [Acidimicrobiales bacterium]